MGGRVADVPTLINVHHYISFLEIVRGNAAASQRETQTVVELSREHGAALYSAVGELSSTWARARLTGAQTGAAELRQALAAYSGHGNKLWLQLFHGLLAELEAERRDAEGASHHIDDALVIAHETGQHWTDALLHRIRGEILLKRDPTDPGPAEDAFLTAIAVAQQQQARSFELRAALSLAKLYQSTGRPADAYAVLAQPLEGFSPTPELPEIEEAQKLLAALADTGEVKKAIAARQRQLKLQTSYGRAMMWSRGFGDKEASAAFERAHDLAAEIDDPAERLTTYYGLWVGRLLRGETGLARASAENFLQEAQRQVWIGEAAVGHRIIGLTCLCQGEFVEAQTHVEEALRTFDPDRDKEMKFRFGTDSGTGELIYLAHTSWILGAVDRTRELIERSESRARQSGHAPTQTATYLFVLLLAMFRGDVGGTLRAAQALSEASEQHQMAFYQSLASIALAWGAARSAIVRAA